MKTRRAFTLYEVLVVIAIIGLLASISFIIAGSAKRSAKKVSCAARLQQLLSSIEMYRNDWDNQWPISLARAFDPGYRKRQDASENRDSPICCPATGRKYDYRAGLNSGSPKIESAWQWELSERESDGTWEKYALLRCQDHYRESDVLRLTADGPETSEGQPLHVLGAFWGNRNVKNVLAHDELDARFSSWMARVVGTDPLNPPPDDEEKGGS